MCVNCLGLDPIIQQVLNKCLLLRTRTPHFHCGCATVGPTLALPRREKKKMSGLFIGNQYPWLSGTGMCFEGPVPVQSETDRKGHFLSEHMALGKLWGFWKPLWMILLKGRTVTPANLRMIPKSLEPEPRSPIGCLGLYSSWGLWEKLEVSGYTSRVWANGSQWHPDT